MKHNCMYIAIVAFWGRCAIFNLLSSLSHFAFFQDLCLQVCKLCPSFILMFFSLFPPQICVVSTGPNSSACFPWLGIPLNPTVSLQCVPFLSSVYRLFRCLFFYLNLLRDLLLSQVSSPSQPLESVCCIQEAETRFSRLCVNDTAILQWGYHRRRRLAACGRRRRGHLHHT